MTIRGMGYCPWCVTELPKSLREEWAKLPKKNIKPNNSGARKDCRSSIASRVRNYHC